MINITIGIEASLTTTAKMGTDWPVNRPMHSSIMGYSPKTGSVLKNAVASGSLGMVRGLGMRFQLQCRTSDQADIFASEMKTQARTAGD